MRDLARKGDVGAGRYGGMIIDVRELKPGLQRGCCETAKEAGDPEAHAAFIGKRGL